MASLWSEQAHCRPVEEREGKSELNHPEWRRLSVVAKEQGRQQEPRTEARRPRPCLL